MKKKAKLERSILADHEFARSELDAIVDKATQLGAKGLLWIRFKDGVADSPVANFLPEDFFVQGTSKFSRDLIKKAPSLLLQGPMQKHGTLLGRLRLEIR